MKIKIIADEALAKYTHAAPESAAQELAEHIAHLQSLGYTVTAATSSRAAVPNSYRSAYKMCAPIWVYRADKQEIEMVSAQLQNRPKGRAIPAHLHVQGTTTPVGYRALRKGDNSLDLIPA